MPTTPGATTTTDPVKQDAVADLSGALQRVYSPVREDLDEVSDTLRSLAYGQPPFIMEMLEHVLATTGKRIRPAVTLLSSRFHPSDGSKARLMATGVEMLHIATPGPRRHDRQLGVPARPRDYQRQVGEERRRPGRRLHVRDLSDLRLRYGQHPHHAPLRGDHRGAVERRAGPDGQGLRCFGDARRVLRTHIHEDGHPVHDREPVGGRGQRAHRTALSAPSETTGTTLAWPSRSSTTSSTSRARARR